MREREGQGDEEEEEEEGFKEGDAEDMDKGDEDEYKGACRSS